MPRIPVRTEPYSSPTRQHRHFKSKRDIILRTLGKAAFINGSQFAILWVTASGQIETYGSDVLQPKLEHWFNERVLDEAKRLVLNANERRHVQSKFNKFNSILEPVTDETTEEDCQNPFLNSSSPQDFHSSIDSDEMESKNLGKLPPDSPSRNTRARKKLSPLDPNVANSIFAPTVPSLNSKPPSLPTSSSDVNVNLPNSLIFTSESDVKVYTQSKFIELQQTSCKRVCKAWIKIIEPKKQTRFPYQKGDEVKPNWWPTEIRHREPDHLQKTERIDLLVHLLFTGLVTIQALELATAAIAAYIPGDKMNILRDIYQVAKALEDAKKSNTAGEFVKFSVQVSAPSEDFSDNESKSRKRPRLPRSDSEGPMKSTRLAQRRRIGVEARLDLPSPLFAPNHSPFYPGMDPGLPSPNGLVPSHLPYPHHAHHQYGLAPPLPITSEPGMYYVPSPEGHPHHAMTWPSYAEEARAHYAEEHRNRYGEEPGPHYGEEGGNLNYGEESNGMHYGEESRNVYMEETRSGFIEEHGNGPNYIEEHHSQPNFIEEHHSQPNPEWAHLPVTSQPTEPNSYFPVQPPPFDEPNAPYAVQMNSVPNFEGPMEIVN